jgi:hypothetical protein
MPYRRQAISSSRPAEWNLLEAQKLVYSEDTHQYIRHLQQVALETVGCWVYKSRAVVERMCRIGCRLWRNRFHITRGNVSNGRNKVALPWSKVIFRLEKLFSDTVRYVCTPC